MISLLMVILTKKFPVTEIYNASSWWGIFIEAIIVWITVEYALDRLRLSTFTKYILITLSGIALYADAFGTIFLFYDRFYRYDWLMHFSVPAVLAVWLWHVLRKLVALPPKWHMWLVITSTVFLSNLFEFAEYAADTFWVKKHYWIAERPDTVEDILFNTVGAVVAILVMTWIEKKITISKQWSKGL